MAMPQHLLLYQTQPHRYDYGKTLCSIVIAMILTYGQRTEEELAELKAKEEEESAQLSAALANINVQLHASLLAKNVKLADDEQTAEDAMFLLREAAAYLVDKVIPRVIQELYSLEVPVWDGQTLSQHLHMRGVNMRYLGVLTRQLPDKTPLKVCKHPISNPICILMNASNCALRR